MSDHRLPDGALAVVVSGDTPDLLRDDALALLTYVVDHPAVPAAALSAMLFRTRVFRRHRALLAITDRDGLIDALRAVVDGRDHPGVVRTGAPATARKTAFVFPGQGGQRPGMGRMFYDAVPAYRTEVDRCAAAFETHAGQSPLKYVLDDHFPADDAALVVQPALFTHMAGLASAWRSFGVEPATVVGHSQGEIAAAYVAGLVSLNDAVFTVTTRARAADGFTPGAYGMGVIAADRDACDDVLARSTGWAQVSVVNSRGIVGISGDLDAVRGVVETLDARGTFARVIAVRYPAHTTLMNGLGDEIRSTLRGGLENPGFLDSEIDCIGATLGEPITGDLPVDEYWFWNLRNTVRFDKAVAAAVGRDVDTFVELSDHPALQLAVEETLAAVAPERSTAVVGTSTRTATDLGEFTRNLARLAVHQLDYPWERLRADTTGPIPLPLSDFPNTPMSRARFWQAYDEGAASPPPVQVQAAAPAPVAAPAHQHGTPARLLVEKWVRLPRLSLLPPRTIGIVDHAGECDELATALCAAAGDIGATADVVTKASATTDLDTLVILLPPPPEQDVSTAAADVAAFFGERAWWPGIGGGVTDCWLVTTGGEAAVDGDAPPNLLHAAASAGFRSVGASHPGVRFRHLDLPAGSVPEASAMLTALHVRDESELALRGGTLYAKRVVDGEAATDASTPDHVLIVGGTGNLGLEFCDRLARSGARMITLISRSGETEAVAGRLRQIRSVTSADIRVARCDVTDEASVASLAEGLPPVDLVLHTAVEYSGAELEDITTEMVDTALRAKVVGVDRLLKTLPMTGNARVVLCSSISANIGGRGMILYAASNRMTDAMALRLQAEGTDCVAVQWGHWKVHGDSGADMLAGIGVIPMEPADALAIDLTRLRGNAVVTSFDLDRARSVLDTCGRASLLAELSEPVAAVTAQPAESADITGRFVTMLAETIGAGGADTIDLTIPMVAIGLDSLQALEFRRRVKAEFDYELEVADLLSGASAGDVLARLGA